MRSGRQTVRSYGSSGRSLPRVSLALMGCALLAACASPPPRDLAAEIPAFAGAKGIDPGTLPDAGAFLAVDDQMREFVRERLAGEPNALERLQRLYAELLEPGGLGITYDEGLTQPARDVFRTRTGNCLSVSALVVVMAREAGLEAGFQDVPVLPHWRISGNAFIVERHVNALVHVGSRRFMIDFRPPEAATYTEAKPIGDGDATAQFFGNLGVERFTGGDLEGAYLHFRRGIQAEPQSAISWLNMGVALARNGQREDAERAYRIALELDPGNLSALNNLAVLLKAHGNSFGARRLRARVEAYRRTNPQYLYWLGEQDLQAGRTDEALDAFTAAVRRLPGEAEFHFALARTYRALGDAEAADRSYQAALARASTDAIRRRYETQYQAAPADREDRPPFGPEATILPQPPP